jgi:hypothetical protein
MESVENEAFAGEINETRFIRDTRSVNLSAAVQRIVNYCAAEDIQVIASTPLSLRLAEGLEYPQRNELISQIDLWVNSLVLGTRRMGKAVSDEKSLRRFCEMTNTYIRDDFYKKIDDGDVVEVYTFDSSTGQVKQTWRNWRFLEMCSYDVLLLMTTPMLDLFHRNEKTAELLVSRIGEVFTDQRTKPCDVPAHVITERMHQKNRLFQITNKFYTPLFSKKDQVIGFACSQTAISLGSAYSKHANVEPLEK